MGKVNTKSFWFIPLIFFLSFSLFQSSFLSPAKAETDKKNMPSQEFSDLKIAVGAYEDGLYKIAVNYLEGFLKKYPNSKHKLQVSILLADAYRITGSSVKALKIYRTILRHYKINHPDTLVQIHYAIYKLLLKERKPEEAFDHLKFIVEVSFKKKIKNVISYQAFLELSRHYERQGNSAKAESILSKLILMNPPALWYEKALLEKASLLVKENRFKETVSLLAPSIKKMHGPDDDNKTFYLYWAVSNLKLKRYCRAQEIYSKLLKLFSDSPTLLPVLSGYMISSFRCFADATVRAKVFQSLEKRYRKRLSVLFQVYYLEGLLYFQENQYEKAKNVWIQVLERFQDHPKIPEILLKLNKIFLNSNDLKNWESLLLNINKGKKFLPESKDVANLLLGDLYFSQKKYETALPFYFNVINKKKYRRYGLKRIVLSYYYLGKFKEARTNLGILLLENPRISDQPDMLFLKADLFLRVGKTDKALFLLKKLASQKTHKKTKESRFWQLKAELELGKLHYHRGDFVGAKKYLLDVFKNALPGNVEDNRIAAFYLGLIAIHEKNFEMADTYLQIASLSMNPKIKVEALFRRGQIEKRLKNFYEGIKIFQKIIRDYPKQKEWIDLSHFELAGIYIYLHNYERATPHLKYLTENSNDEAMKKKSVELLHEISKKKND